MPSSTTSCIRTNKQRKCQSKAYLLTFPSLKLLGDLKMQICKNYGKALKFKTRFTQQILMRMLTLWMGDDDTKLQKRYLDSQLTLVQILTRYTKGTLT